MSRGCRITIALTVGFVWWYKDRLRREALVLLARARLRNLDNVVQEWEMWVR